MGPGGGPTAGQAEMLAGQPRDRRAGDTLRARDRPTSFWQDIPGWTPRTPKVSVQWLLLHRHLAWKLSVICDDQIR